MGDRTIAIVLGHDDTVIPGAACRLQGPTPDQWYDGTTNADGYVAWTVAGSLGDSHVQIVAAGYAGVSQHVHLTCDQEGGARNQSIRFGAGVSDLDDLLFPALTRLAHLLPARPLYGAFCIPGALPGIPFGDGKRIWTPAFACYANSTWQDRMLDAIVARRYNVLEYQVSGFPYRGEYPEIPLDIRRTVDDLDRIHRRDVATMIAFRDDVGVDLGYLRGVAAATQDLVDYVMGIYECNGVFKDGTGASVLAMLVQARTLWPRAKLGVHFTDLMGSESYGLVDWQQAVDRANLNLLLFQASGWAYTPAQVAARVADYTRRLGGPGWHGYPTLSDGINLFELTTSKTFWDGMTEAEGVAYTDAVRACPMAPDGGVWSVPVTGFLDGGTP